MLTNFCLSLTITIVLFFCSLFASTNGEHAEEYVGFDLIKRDQLVPIGRRIVLFKDIMFRKGRVTQFHALFGGNSAFHFQIWRRLWSTLGQENYVLVADINIATTSQNTTIDVHDEEIYTEEGDRLGFLNDDITSSPVLASTMSYFDTSTIFSDIPASAPLPAVGQTRSFDPLVYPYVFSVGATYIPDVHELGLFVGATGDTGATGPQGRVGYTGDVGPAGAMGSSGPAGDTGKSGRPGTKGEIGYTGPPGPNGTTGEPGWNGTKGERGPPGIAGEKGVAGSHGRNGSHGSTGATGGTGPTGQHGSVGPKGELGPEGDDGATGHTGPHGPDGAKGDPGVMGATGQAGHTGPVGDAGPVGPPGPAGVEVAVGDRGYNVTYRSNTVTYVNGDGSECDNSILSCEHSCVMENAIPTCRCNTGYTLRQDDNTCKDVNECLINNGGCQLVCVDFEGSYKCQCSKGLKLSPNGHTCVDVLECDVNNGGCGTELCIDMYSSNLCLDKDVGHNMVISDSEELSDADSGSELLRHRVVMGLIIWLALLTLLILLVIVCCCLQRRSNGKHR